MIDKIDAKTVLEVLSVIGWGAGLIVVIRSAIRHLAGKAKAETPEDANLAAAINRDLLKEIAYQFKELNERYHGLSTKLAVLESRQQGMEAEIKRRT